MSFGFGVGDFLAVIKLANKIRKDFSEAPAQFKEISDEVRSLAIILQDLEVLSEHKLNEEETKELHEIARGCGNVLEKLELTLDKYHELQAGPKSGTKSVKRIWKRLKWEPDDISELRSRLVTNITLLNAFQARIDRLLNTISSYVCQTKLYSQLLQATKVAVDHLKERQDDYERHTIREWLTPIDHAPQQSDRARHLQHLGSWDLRNYEAKGSISDLDKARQQFQEALDRTPSDHPDRAHRLQNLGAILFNSYEVIGNLKDLEAAIHQFQEALDITPSDHPDRAHRLQNLGAILLNRFEFTGNLKDLEAAIHQFQEALDRTPSDHPDRALRLHYLGAGLYKRFQAIGNSEDLVTAIQRVQEALERTPTDHPDQAHLLQILGLGYHGRYRATGAFADLQNAIKVQQQKIATTPKDRPYHTRRLHVLESQLREGSQTVGALKDLDGHDESILDLENQPRLPMLEDGTEHDFPEGSVEDGSVFSLLQSISSKSSAQNAGGATRELVILLKDNTQLRSLYPSLRQNFEFSVFRLEFHQLLRVFSKELAREALVPIERESVRFITQQRRRVSHAIGREVFGLKNQSLLESISQQQHLNTRERIEKYLRDATQPKGGSDDLSLRQEHTSDNDSTDEDELEPFSHLEYAEKFLIESKAFENLRISIRKLAAHGEESTKELRSRHDAMESKDKVKNDEKQSDTMVKQGSIRRMVIPEPRAIVRATRIKLMATIRRCSWAMLRLFRHKLEVGSWRLEWQCDCGKPLYGDFRGEFEEICKLAKEIQAHGYFVTQSSHEIKQRPAGSTQTTTSNSAVLANLESDTSLTAQNASLSPNGIISRALGGRQYPTVVSTVTAPSSLPVTGDRSPKFVALCVKTGRFQNTYGEIDISTIPRSTQIFHDFKKTYEACVGSRRNPFRRWLTRPVDIGFIQFAVEGFRRVYPIPGSPDCTICAHAEMKDELVTARKYEPHLDTVSLTHPPIPPDLFFHLWECPAQITPSVQNMWLSRLPKKLDEKLENMSLRTRPDGELILGWGVLVIEGLHKRKISRMTFSVAVVSIIISVTYSACMTDVSSGFAVGALLVGCWTMFVTAIYFEWVAG
ncbi:hypothetical protein VTL71DRAFT_11107 [Oculimacula yallundae]|uniref:Uncharacterized protein n=1 Tax=Oculimacula yallundae TaxID=86028 RepID=A0ABR4CV08_9HELO